MTAIKVHQLSKTYGKTEALHPISFEVEKGQVFGYIGPNGAGKTTTIKILVGLLNKTTGEASINGFDMPLQKNQVHRVIGYLPQNPGFQQWRTVNHALTTFGLLSGMTKNQIDKRIQELLTILNLTHVRHTKISKLSGGMIQKVGIAQALLHEPEILLLDEPLTGLDPESRYQVKNIIRQLSKNGTTVFFSSHILSDVQDVATHICIIDWGRRIALGPLQKLITDFSEAHRIKITFSKKLKGWTVIRDIPGIDDIQETSDNTVMITLAKTGDTDTITHQILKTLIEQDCRLLSFAPLTPSLDEIYQHFLRKGGKNA
jgi:ABC-2 type transport system ATP-binding protein